MFSALLHSDTIVKTGTSVTNIPVQYSNASTIHSNTITNFELNKLNEYNNYCVNNLTQTQQQQQRPAATVLPVTRQKPQQVIDSESKHILGITNVTSLSHSDSLSVNNDNIVTSNANLQQPSNVNQSNIPSQSINHVNNDLHQVIPINSNDMETLSSFDVTNQV